MPGVTRLGLLQRVLRAVVVDHQELPGVDDAAQPLGEDHLLRLGLDGLLAVGPRLALDQRGLRLGDRVAERDEVVLAQRAPGGDDVGDRVGQAELHRDLHGAVELDDVGADAAAGEVGPHQPGVGGGDLLALEVLELPLPPVDALVRRGEAELRVAEAQREDAADLAARLVHQVGTGDAQLQVARADVGGDVLGPQVEELDVVLFVEHREVAVVIALAVPGLAHHRGGGFGQCALVGQGDAEHALSSLVLRATSYRNLYTSSSPRPRPSMSTCSRYSSCEISSASASSASCSAASHTSPASSSTFLPCACTPASSAATVAEPAGRVAAFSLSSANSSSKVFTPRLPSRLISLMGRVRSDRARPVPCCTRHPWCAERNGTVPRVVRYASRADRLTRPAVSRGALASCLRVAGLQVVAREPDE